jgi:3-oxoacyl-(acyl-carrier-protein) synthase
VLAAWADAPPLAAFHARLRRPTRVAAALTQLAHATLQARTRARASGLNRSHVGILLGTESGSAAADREFLASTQQRGAAFGSPGNFVYTLASSALAEISIGLGLQGPVLTFAAGAASGLTALGAACAEVKSGRVEACIAGQMETGAGADEWLALFLLEPAAGERGGAWLEAGAQGFSPGAPATTDPPGVLRLADALGKPGVTSFREVDASGAWAEITLRRASEAPGQ